MGGMLDRDVDRDVEGAGLMDGALDGVGATSSSSTIVVFVRNVLIVPRINIPHRRRLPRRRLAAALVGRLYTRHPCEHSLYNRPCPHVHLHIRKRCR